MNDNEIPTWKNRLVEILLILAVIGYSIAVQFRLLPQSGGQA